jgi:hypothetical protein
MEANPSRNAGSDWDTFAGRGDPEQRYRLYRVCPGETTPELIATCASEEAVGVALCLLGREQELVDCALGVLDTGENVEKGQRWILKPWRAMPKEVSHAASVLARSKKSVS